MRMGIGSSQPRRVVLLVDVPLSEQVALPSVLDSSSLGRRSVLRRSVSRGSGTERDDFVYRRPLLVRVTLRHVAVDVVPALPDEGVVGRTVRHLMSDCRLTSGRGCCGWLMLIDLRRRSTPWARRGTTSAFPRPHSRGGPRATSVAPPS